MTLALEALSVKHVNRFKTKSCIEIVIHYKLRITVAIMDVQLLKMVWSG